MRNLLRLNGSLRKSKIPLLLMLSYILYITKQVQNNEKKKRSLECFTKE